MLGSRMSEVGMSESWEVGCQKSEVGMLGSRMSEVGKLGSRKVGSWDVGESGIAFDGNDSEAELGSMNQRRQ